MPELDPMDHHRDIPYAETGYQRQPDFNAEPASDGLGFEVTGICPACGGHTSMLFERGSPQGHKGGWFRRAATPSPGPEPATVREVTVYCECGHIHENRPAEAIDNGCGAFWQVEPP